MKRVIFQGVEIASEGQFAYQDVDCNKHSCQFPLFLIDQAWQRGCDFECLADGFGVGMGTMGGDWSGIRDSSDNAITAMFTRAMNFMFGT